jgi:3-oxoadipate CoA-transferase alpha subunit
MIDKVVADIDAAVADIAAGSTVLVGGFGEAGVPRALISALVRRAVRGLTVVSNNCGSAEDGVAELFKAHLVSRVMASFPLTPGNHHFMAALDAGEVVVEVIPQGTLAARLYAGGAGLAGFYTPTGAGTEMAAGRETRRFGDRDYLLELPINADVALIHADVADTAGNLRYRRAARNFNPVMARAARLTIAEVNRIVPVGAIDPDDVHTPGIFVDRVVNLGAAR